MLLLLWLLFGPPQLSTDGQYLAYIKPAPNTKVANVFIRKLPTPSSRSRVVESARSTDSARLARDLSIFERDGTDSDRQITFDSNQGVSAYSWSQDSSSIVYIQDLNGDENYHLYLVPVSNPGHAIDLTPFPGVKAQDVVSSELHPDKLYIVSKSCTADQGFEWVLYSSSCDAEMLKLLGHLAGHTYTAHPADPSFSCAALGF